MRGKSRKTGELRDFILNNVIEHPKSIGQVTAQKFGVSRQAISRHLNELIRDGLLTASGNTRNRTFELRDYIDEFYKINVIADMPEDVIWRESAVPLLNDLKENVLDICHHGFTEMTNNVISHSGSEELILKISRNAINTRITIRDKGIGIFKKIQRDFNLYDPRHSLLELSKGKLTSDESNHSGEGIFFTSRMFDRFIIWSEDLFFARTYKHGEWLVETDSKKEFMAGTFINMEITENSERLVSEVFNRFASEYEDWGFTKTHVPLKLLRYEGEKLISRSQAKRLLSRVDQFKEVLLDFNGITEIGQAFADEIFRVFNLEHPETIISVIHTTNDIDKMIERVSVSNEIPSKNDSTQMGLV